MSALKPAYTDQYRSIEIITEQHRVTQSDTEWHRAIQSKTKQKAQLLQSWLCVTWVLWWHTMQFTFPPREEVELGVIVENSNTAFDRPIYLAVILIALHVLDDELISHSCPGSMQDCHITNITQLSKTEQSSSWSYCGSQWSRPQRSGKT